MVRRIITNGDKQAKVPIGDATNSFDSAYEEIYSQYAYTVERGIQNINEHLRADDLVCGLKNRQFCHDAITWLDDELYDNPQRFCSVYKSMHLTDECNIRYYIPECLIPSLNFSCNGTGAGELSFFCMFKNVKWRQPHDMYDFDVSYEQEQNVEPLHFKDMRNAVSSTLSRAGGYSTFLSSDILSFVKSCDINVNKFGVNTVKNNASFVDAIMKRYDVKDVEVAAQLFENELNSEFRTHCFGNAQRIVYLSKNDIGYYLECFHKNNNYFYALSSRGVHVCVVPDRFKNAILATT
jgi:hypothetical protein